jgi:hypothetical protein
MYKNMHPTALVKSTMKVVMMMVSETVSNEQLTPRILELVVDFQKEDQCMLAREDCSTHNPVAEKLPQVKKVKNRVHAQSIMVKTVNLRLLDES